MTKQQNYAKRWLKETRGIIMSGYAKDIKDVLEDCERALQSIQACGAYDGTTCKPNKSDLCLVAIARDAIREYCNLRDIKLHYVE